MTIILPNLTFEDELTCRPTRASADTERALHELAPLMALLAQPHDTVALHEGMLPDTTPPIYDNVQFVERNRIQPVIDAVIVPWGWTENSRRLAVSWGMDPVRIPSLDAVYQVNSRAFSATFDPVVCESRLGLPFGSDSFGILCRSLQEWEDAVARMASFGYGRWVAKPQVSHAGRNRLLCNGRLLNGQQQGWLEKHLKHSDGIYLEPWVTPLEECGLQFEILPPEDGSVADGVMFVGITRLLNDHVGRYQGSLFGKCDQPGSEWQQAIDHGFRVCHAARKLGYWGPLGIDCFRFRDQSGNVATRLCNDINGRFTMGRLALQLRSSIQSEQYGLWCQFATKEFERLSSRIRNRLAENGSNSVRLVDTSPSMISGKPVRSGTLLLTGESAEDLLNLVSTVRAEQS